MKRSRRYWTSAECSAAQFGCRVVRKAQYATLQRLFFLVKGMHCATQNGHSAFETVIPDRFLRFLVIAFTKKSISCSEPRFSAVRFLQCSGEAHNEKDSSNEACHNSALFRMGCALPSPARSGWMERDAFVVLYCMLHLYLFISSRRN